MIVTTRGRYAVAAILEIAICDSHDPIKLAEIADKQNIPQNYLEQIFAKLKKAKLVKAIKGPGGGYLLINKPESINIASIIDAVEENIEMSNCKLNNRINCRTDKNIKCNSHFIWEGLTKQIRTYFEGLTLQDVIINNEVIFSKNI